MNIKLVPLVTALALAIGCQSNISAQQPVKTEINRKFPQVFNTEYPPTLGRYDCVREYVKAGSVDTTMSFELLEGNTYEYNSQQGNYTPSIHVNRLNLEGFYQFTPPSLAWNNGSFTPWNSSYYGTNNQNKSIIILAEYPNRKEAVYICLHQGN